MDNENKDICSFCHRHENEAGPLVNGPDGVKICRQCVDFCAMIYTENEEEEQSADFLMHKKPEPREWESALKLVESVYMPISPRFFNMTKAEIKSERLMAKGLM